MEREIRAIQGFEIRAADEANDARIEGYAARYDVETEIAGFVEVIRPGAFARAVDEGQDVRCLVDHDSSRILGRTKADTLRLEERDEGLWMSVDVPATTVGADTLVSVERGDLDAMSFAFLPARDGGERVSRRSDGRELRELLDLDVFDVSIVTYPAYADADFALALRSVDAYRYLEREALAARFASMRRRIRLAEIDGHALGLGLTSDRDG